MNPKNNLRTLKYINNINALLNARSMSQSDLARALNKSTGTMSGMMKENSNPTLNTLLELAEYFNISIAQLIGELPLSELDNLISYEAIPILKMNEIKHFFIIERPTIVVDIYETILYAKKDTISSNPFAIRGNRRTEPLYDVNSLLIFDKLVYEITEYDKRIVLVSNNTKEPLFKRLYVEGEEIYLEPINKVLPIKRKDEHTNIIAALAEVRINYSE